MKDQSFQLVQVQKDSSRSKPGWLNFQKDRKTTSSTRTQIKVNQDNPITSTVIYTGIGILLAVVIVSIIIIMKKR
jgi:hypothetical protein